MEGLIIIEEEEFFYSVVLGCFFLRQSNVRIGFCVIHKMIKKKSMGCNRIVLLLNGYKKISGNFVLNVIILSRVSKVFSYFH